MKVNKVVGRTYIWFTLLNNNGEQVEVVDLYPTELAYKEEITDGRLVMGIRPHGRGYLYII